jgi:transcriptional regulator with XRE-family HTH domain
LIFNGIDTIINLMNNLTSLGSEVKTRRRERDLKQRQLAQMTGLPPETLCRFENGNLADFSVNKLLRVLSALDLDLVVRPKGSAITLDDLRVERQQTQQ